MRININQCGPHKIYFSLLTLNVVRSVTVLLVQWLAHYTTSLLLPSALTQAAALFLGLCSVLNEREMWFASLAAELIVPGLVVRIRRIGMVLC